MCSINVRKCEHTYAPVSTIIKIDKYKIDILWGVRGAEASHSLIPAFPSSSTPCFKTEDMATERFPE